MKNFWLLIGIVFSLALFGAEKPKYIFLFIGDGMSTPQRMIADEFAHRVGHGPLKLNRMVYHATTRTCSANSLVTDSAASGTAIACGEKTSNGRIGMAVDGERKLVSVAEVARDSGKKVGIVTSVTINHATPAAFYAHRANRGQYYAIGLDMVDSRIDYFGGGDCSQHNKKDDPLYRGDIYDLLKKAGYKLVSTKKDLLNLSAADGKVYARGGTGGKIPFTIDADGTVATLAEFTAKGIELLDNPKGFFMMIEGGSIDWAGHSNDAATNLNEVLALDNAVQVALDFAAKHPDETLIVVTGDHETGGMTMGFAGTGYALYVDRLALQKISVEKFTRMLKAEYPGNFEAAKKMITENFGLEFSGKSPMTVTPEELALLEKAYNDKKLPNVVRQIVAAKAGVGWTTGAHTALPVLTTSQGCGAENFTGFFDNSEISLKLKQLL